MVVTLSTLPEVESISISSLLDEKVNNLLDVLQGEVMAKELGFASHDDVEAVCLTVHPHFRTYCDCDCVVVCHNGGRRCPKQQCKVCLGTFAGPIRGVDFLGTGTNTCTDTCAFSGTWIFAGTCTFACTSTPKASMIQHMKREKDCCLAQPTGRHSRRALLLFAPPLLSTTSCRT